MSYQVYIANFEALSWEEMGKFVAALAEFAYLDHSNWANEYALRINVGNKYVEVTVPVEVPVEVWGPIHDQIAIFARGWGLAAGHYLT